MRMPPQAAADSPQHDIIRILNRLEAMTPLKYCHHCFGIADKCRCTSVPHQASDPGPVTWTPLVMSYATMASTMMTTASSSVAVVTPMSHPPQRLPPGLPTPPGIPALLSLLPTPPPQGQLLAHAGVGRGHGPRSQGVRLPAPGPYQVRPTAQRPGP